MNPLQEELDKVTQLTKATATTTPWAQTPHPHQNPRIKPGRQGTRGRPRLHRP
ncbi:hypothetical protein LINPERHAP1_LOCUS9118 [Linum perenne]